MSTRALIIRRKGGVYQYGQSKMDGYMVADELNKWVPANAADRDWFFHRMFEEEYEWEKNGRSFKGRGLGLYDAGSDRSSTRFYADFKETDKSEWGYNNGEIEVDDARVSTTNGLVSWLALDGNRVECPFDWPDYIIMWSEKENKFLSFSLKVTPVEKILESLKSL